MLGNGRARRVAILRDKREDGLQEKGWAGGEPRELKGHVQAGEHI